jgi:gliding motility-associated-like protein
MVNPVPEAIFTVSPQYMWTNQIAYTFNHTSNITPAGEVYGIWYKWDMGDGSPIDTTLNTSHMYTKTGKYDVSLTVGTYSEPPCISTRTIEDAIEVVNAGDIILPNAFKPDPSGEPSDVIPSEQSYRNYLFFPPVMLPTRDYHLAVYNRWGQLIYQSNDPTRGWNGYFKGQLCPEGVYVYRIWGTFENGQSFQKRGDVLIMR